MENSANNHSQPKLNFASVIFYIVLATVAVGLYSRHLTGFTPFIHDEQSYLFQAKTFLAGRLTNPTHPEKLFFDQYHILNEGVYASKYFPGYAITLMPFVLLGVPYLNPLLFYALQLGLVFLIARELFGPKTAWLAMILTSFSPQIVYQACLLLGHVSCAVFLLLFFYLFLKSENGKSPWPVLIAGFSWGCAFLIRPISAIGFSVPVAAVVFYRFYRHRYPKSALRLLAWVCPLLLTGILYCLYNKAVTGSYFETPFDAYARIHAPYHRYGFNTWEKYAAEARGPRVDSWFNEYYHNHTPLIGLEFMGIRLSFLLQFLFGSTPIGVAFLILWLIQLRRRNPADWLIFAVFLSLQIIHIPHWYPGILTIGSNYLYESTGLLILALSHAILSQVESIRRTRWRSIALAAVLTLCATSSASSFLEAPSWYVFGGRSLKAWLVRTLQTLSPKPKIVFVRYPPRFNVNLECFIENPPGLKDPLLFVRNRSSENAKLLPYYPGYSVYLWDFPPGILRKLKE
jgi:hypothetical protein